MERQGLLIVTSSTILTAVLNVNARKKKKEERDSRKVKLMHYER